MKLCDVTQFYAPRSGGVKRYLHEKIRYAQQAGGSHEHVLIVPGARSNVTSDGISRVYTIASPIVSRSSGYRALLDLRAIDEILERERPNLIESSDPYQLGWHVADVARMLGIPAVAFYHSHFPEAYLRPVAARLGERIADCIDRLAREYVRKLYNRYAATFVSSRTLAQTLTDWGVRNVHVVSLGVDTGVFRPGKDAAPARQELGIDETATLLLYVGRLAAEKNTRLLFDAFRLLNSRRPNKFHLLVIGDGPERADLERLQRDGTFVTWKRHCADPAELARFYRAADLFVHPGMRETFGLAAVESQACGTPVVGIAGTRLDDVIVHDQSCWARENSAAALADAIEAMSEQDLRATGVAASDEVAERFAWTAVFDRLFCIYAEVCSNYRRTSA